MSPHQLEIRDLTVAYRGTTALRRVNLQLRGGRCVGLLGPNGAGKSTLLKSVARLVPTVTGEVCLDANARASTADRSVAYLPQRSVVDWDFPLTVRGLVEMGRYPLLGSFARFGPGDSVAVEQALDSTRLRPLADRQISALSGGQQQRAFLARAVAQGAHAYLLDEPFTGLDRNAQAVLSELLRSLARDQGKLVIVSHHDLRTVEELFDDVIFLNGELLACGPVEEVFTPENIARTYATEALAAAG